MTNDRKFLIIILMLQVAVGIIDPFLQAGDQQNAIAVIQSFITAFFLFSWTKAHAHAHGILPPKASPLLTALLLPIGLPYYAWGGFGFKKGSILLGKAVLFFLLMMLCYAIPFLLIAHFISGNLQDMS